MPPLPPPQAGAITFEQLAEIAVGTTARVDLCRATDAKHAGRLLAVKRLHPHIAEDPAFANEFLDEVWLTASLHSPYVVEMVGWGSDAQGSFLAVELVQGVSLARLMKTVFDTGEMFSERMVVFLALCMCRGLEAAHELRAPDGEHLHLVHRDLMPGNVLVGFQGDVKIADLGLAKAKQRLTRTLTGLWKGQPQYMAPEQAKGQEIDGRADLFALGIVLFELFSGKRPWQGANEFELVQNTATLPPADLRELRPKIDRELVAIVTQCLEKSPERRFQSAGAVAKRLEHWLETHGYAQGNEEALARFVRRNAMRQMRWFERAIAGELRNVPARSSLLPTSDAAVEAPPASLGDRTHVTDLDGEQGAAKPTPTLESHPTPVKGAKPSKGAADLDWGEEVPTLVQRRGAGLPPPKVRTGAKLPPPRPKSKLVPDRSAERPFESIVDEDDQRTTSVKPRVQIDIRMPDGAPAASATAVTPLPAIFDEDSSDLPTTPVKRTPMTRRPPPSAPAAAADFAATTPDRLSPFGDERVLVAEASRLASEAEARAEVARQARALAERAERIAQLAHDAATVAARGVALTRAGDHDEALHRFQDARALEAKRRALADEGATSPLGAAGPIGAIGTVGAAGAVGAVGAVGLGAHAAGPSSGAEPGRGSRPPPPPAPPPPTGPTTPVAVPPGDEPWAPPPASQPVPLAQAPLTQAPLASPGVSPAALAALSQSSPSSLGAPPVAPQRLAPAQLDRLSTGFDARLFRRGFMGLTPGQTILAGTAAALFLVIVLYLVLS